MFRILSMLFLLSGGSASHGIETSDPVGVLGSLPPGVPAEVTILPGVYPLPADGLILDGLQNVTIHATGVVFAATNPMGTALRLRNCADVTIRGLTLDYDPLPFTQGTLTAIDPVARTVDFAVHDGYPDLTDAYLVERFHLFEKDQHRWKPGTPDYYVNRVERLNLREGRIFLRSTDPGFSMLETGDRVVLNIRNAAGIYIQAGCSGIVWEDVTVHAAPGIAMMIRFAEEAGTFERLRVVPGPLPSGATEPRLLSSSADAFNAAYARKGPVLEDCEFAYMGDDSVNLHGVTLPVLMWENARTLISMRPYHTDRFEDLLRSGDEVRFLSEPDYRLIEAALISGITRTNAPADVDWLPLMQSIWPSFLPTQTPSFYRIVLDRDVDPGTEGIFLEAFATSAPDYVIRNCYFHDHRARGLRIMAGNGLVESNRFERIKGAAISLGPEFVHWNEAGWVENAVIRGNVIRDAGQGTDILAQNSYTLGAISVFARIYPDGAGTAYYPGNRNLLILDNEIEGAPLSGIHIVAAKDVLIEGNAIREVHRVSAPNAGKSYGLSPGSGAVTVQHSESVDELNNYEVSVRYSAEIPSDNILAGFNPGVQSGLEWRDNQSGRREIGQSFLAPYDSVMGAFSLQARGSLQSGAHKAPFTVTIYESGTIGALGTILSIQSGVYLDGSFTQINGGWVTFDIRNVNLIAGKYYTFRLSFDGNAQNQSQVFNHQSSGDGFPDGRLWQANNGASFISSVSSDWAFVVQQ